MQAMQFDITPEQVAYARKLVDFSITNHNTPNSWLNPDKTQVYRLAGTLCEVIFADLYNLARPVRAFGAAGGQDYGLDYKLAGHVIDIKGRLTNAPRFYNYCINAWQVERGNCRTDYYYFMHCYPIANPQKCVLLGSASHDDVKAERVATRREAGQRKGAVVWDNDVFDVSLQKLRPVKVPPNAPPNLEAVRDIVIVNYT